jgi:hypothetical protein
LAKSKPKAAVEVAEVPVRAKYVADMPEANVLVPCPAPTVMAEAKVEVAEVEVAMKFFPTTVPATESIEYGVDVPMPTRPSMVTEEEA